MIEHEVVIEDVADLRWTCESRAPPTPTGHLLDLHRLLGVLTRLRAPLGEVAQRRVGRVLHALAHQQAGDDHAGAPLAALAVDRNHVGGVLHQPRVALVHNLVDLVYTSHATRARTHRARVVVLDAVVRVTAAEALDGGLGVGAFGAEVEPMLQQSTDGYTQ